MYWLTGLKLHKFLTESAPSKKLHEPLYTQKLTIYNETDFVCNEKILSCLSDILYDIYYTTGTAKELWDLLNKKYHAKGVGFEIYVVDRFILEFKINDKKSILKQSNELQGTCHEMSQKDIPLTDKLLIAVYISLVEGVWIKP